MDVLISKLGLFGTGEESPQRGGVSDGARTCSEQPDPEARKAIADASGARPEHLTIALQFVVRKYGETF
jgi:hypothetical protein